VRKAKTEPDSKVKQESAPPQEKNLPLKEEQAIVKQPQEAEVAIRSSKSQLQQLQASEPHAPSKDKPKQSLSKSPKRKKSDSSPKRDVLSRTPSRKRKRDVCPYAFSFSQALRNLVPIQKTRS
jgi:hypothetical protein